MFELIIQIIHVVLTVIMIVVVGLWAILFLGWRKRTKELEKAVGGFKESITEYTDSIEKWKAEVDKGLQKILNVFAEKKRE